MQQNCYIISWRFIKLLKVGRQLLLPEVDINLSVIFHSFLGRIILQCCLCESILPFLKYLKQLIKYRYNLLNSTVAASLTSTFQKAYSFTDWVKDINIVINNLLVIYIKAANFNIEACVRWRLAPSLQQYNFLLISIDLILSKGVQWPLEFGRACKSFIIAIPPSLNGLDQLLNIKVQLAKTFIFIVLK